MKKAYLKFKKIRKTNKFKDIRYIRLRDENEWEEEDNEDESSTEIYKLVVMGTCHVGKSALTIKLVKNIFVTEYDPTIEDSYRRQAVVDKKPCQLDILDTMGMEEEEDCPLRNQFIHWGEGFLFVYAVNDFDSFKNVNVLWDHLRRLKDTDHIPVVLVANKVDVTNKTVDPTQGREVARSFGVPFVETSAKTGQGVEQAFHELVREIRRKRAEEMGLESLPNTKKRQAWELKHCVIL